MARHIDPGATGTIEQPGLSEEFESLISLTNVARPKLRRIIEWLLHKLHNQSAIIIVMSTCWSDT